MSRGVALPRANASPASSPGNGRPQHLFRRVTAWRNHHGSEVKPGSEQLDNAPPARSFDDYVIKLDHDGLPEGIEMLDLA